MPVVMFILAAMMAMFGVLGYLYGGASALLTLLLVLAGLLLVASAGGQIINIINSAYRFIVAGGLQTMGNSGDVGALQQKMNKVSPLIPSEAAGAFLLLLLVILIVVAVLVGRHKRFRRPSSGVGLLVGLANGYLVGAYLLATLLPSLAKALPLPFGLAAQLAQGRPAAPLPATSGSAGAQLLQIVNGASPASLSLVVMILIAVIIFPALLMNLRGRGSHGRSSGTRG